MMATDSKGQQVGYGDYLAVTEVALDPVPVMTFSGIVRITKIEESPKGVKATGAYVDLVGNGRIGKVPVVIGAATLVMKSDGTVVS
jgi:hypothetical protein